MDQELSFDGIIYNGKQENLAMKPSNVSMLEQKLFKDITHGTISENEEYY